MSLATLTDTICALSTPPGTGALSMIRLSGPDAVTIASKHIESASTLFTALGGDSFYTNVLGNDGEHIDDVVVTVWRAPRSYTGEDIIEFHTHGSPVIAEMLQHNLVSSGARLAEPGEFSRRAFTHGKIGLEELERTLLRVEASSEQALRSVETRLSAKFSRLRAIYESVIALLAEVNAEIDFGDSDEIELQNFSVKLALLRESLDEIIERSSNIRLNTGYYSIALTGPTNVGKSTLFNRLLRFERSIVSDTPGTTRDYLEAFAMLGGFRVKLIDTAGIRETNDHIESHGIRLGSDVALSADILLRITDPSDRSPTVAPDVLLVHNKCDIDNFHDPISISAATGEGISELVKTLTEELTAIDSTSNQFAIDASELTTLKTIRNLLDSSLLNSDIAIVAETIREASEQIAHLAGYNVSEDNLNYIFYKMCIGK